MAQTELSVANSFLTFRLRRNETLLSGDGSTGYRSLAGICLQNIYIKALPSTVTAKFDGQTI